MTRYKRITVPVKSFKRLTEASMRWWMLDKTRPDSVELRKAISRANDLLREHRRKRALRSDNP